MPATDKQGTKVVVAPAMSHQAVNLELLYNCPTLPTGIVLYKYIHTCNLYICTDYCTRTYILVQRVTYTPSLTSSSQVLF